LARRADGHRDEQHVWVVEQGGSRQGILVRWVIREDDVECEQGKLGELLRVEGLGAGRNLPSGRAARSARTSGGQQARRGALKMPTRGRGARPPAQRDRARVEARMSPMRAAGRAAGASGRGRDCGRAAGRLRSGRSDDRLGAAIWPRVPIGSSRAPAAAARNDPSPPGGGFERGEVTNLQPAPGLIDIADHTRQYNRFDRSLIG